MSAIGLEESFYSLRKLVLDFGDTGVDIEATRAKILLIFAQHGNYAQHLRLDFFQFLKVTIHVFAT